MIEELLLGLDSEQPRIRYGAAKALRQCSEQDPAGVYPHFDRFLALMEGDNTFLRWGSERILGNLAAVDRDNKFENVLDRFLAPVSGHEMIGAANVMAAAAQIACAKPHLSDRIARKLLQVSRATYGKPECRNVAIGHALRALDRFFPHLRNKRPALAFARKQLANPRPATRRHAERFLKHWYEISHPR
ncbi:MAG: hypothetical protein P4L56_29275 [Candidatus Sulfopaludibacter sp.]|nr:hypothetical protein [Candidatus Sulfopaludibacter sp.]